MKDIFTTRELAAGIWLLVFMVWAGLRTEVRKSFIAVLRAALHWKLFVPFMFITGYIVVAVRGLYAVGFWTPDLLKDTVLWFLFSGVALAFSGFQTDNQASIWRRAFIDQLKIIVIVQYLVNTYTFSLWTELILLPLFAMVAMIDAVANSDPNFSPVAKLTSWLQILIGLTIISFAVHYALSSSDSFRAFDAMRTILLVPILSVLLMPCILILFLLSAYEQLFLRLKLGSEKDTDVIFYAKRKLISYLGPRPQKVCAFTRAHGLDLMHIGSRSDVDKLLQ